MEVIHCKKIYNHKHDILLLKNMDIDFNYKPKEDEMFVLKSEDKIYGYAVINLSYNIPVLKKIYIEKKIRNNGYGTILLNYVINWLISNNYDSLVVKNHKQMNNFLEKQRFVKTSNGYTLNNLSRLKKEEETLTFVSYVAIAINIVLALIKMIAGKIYFSASLMADGLNSLSDLITNIIVIIGIKYSRSPSDKEHPFGHGKIESVFSVIIGVIIMMTSFDVVKSNISLLFGGKTVNVTNIIVIITILSIVIKTLQLFYMKIKTMKYNSSLIKSLLQDYRSDILITTSVLLGLILSIIHPLFDIVLGIIIALYIMRSSYSLIKENVLILLDSQDENFLEKVKNEVLQIDEVSNAHDFMMTTSGKNIHLYMDIRVDRNITVDEAHEITNKIAKNIKFKYENVQSVLVHVEPVYD